VNVLDKVQPQFRLHKDPVNDFSSQIVNEPGLQENLRNRCSIILRKLCSACYFLPDSHMISSGLEVTSTLPVACSCYAEVHKGSHNGQAVAIKTLRVASADELEKLKTVFLFAYPEQIQLINLPVRPDVL
jgi:hypothetical protein